MFTLKYYIETYGWFYALVERPFESLVTVPLEKATNVIKWIPVLWRDRNWNGSSDIFRVLDFKLSRIEECLKQDTWHEQKGVRESIGEVVEARKCLQRLIKDQYVKKEWQQHNKKFGKLNWKNNGVGSYAKDGSVLTTKMRITPDSKASQKFRIKIWELEEKRKKDDLERFCQILKEKSGGWWT